MNLLKNVTISQILGYFAAAETTRKADIIDMAGYEGVLFIFELGTIISGGTIKATVYGDAANSTSAMAELVGTAAYAVTAITAAYAKSVIAVDIYQPDPALHRYLEAQIQIGAQNAEICGITAIQYKGKLHPDVNGVTVLKATQLVSPAE
jgi:hypothetical protein